MISAKSLKLREFLGYMTLWFISMTAALPVYPAMAAEPPVPAPVSPDYRIGPGDTLKVSVCSRSSM